MALREDAASPCNDSHYLTLQEKDSTLFTSEERQYFHKLKAECTKQTNRAGLEDGKETVLWALGLTAAFLGLMGLVGESVRPH